VGNLEQVFTQRIESLESECQFLRTLVLPQHTQSISINQVSAASRHGNTEEGQGGLGVMPMDIEEESPPQSGVQGSQTMAQLTIDVLQSYIFDGAVC
jgi:hypothetical protein